MLVRNNQSLKIWKVFATFGFVIGFLLICLSLYYLWLYFSEPGNSYRHEYLAGTAMTILYSIPLWLLASYSMYKNKRRVPKLIYISTIAVTIIVCLLFIIGIASPLYLD